MARPLWQQGLIWSSAVALVVQMMLAAILSPSHAVAISAAADEHAVIGHYSQANHNSDHNTPDLACQFWCKAHVNCGSVTSLAPSQGQGESLAHAESRAVLLRSDYRHGHSIALEPPPPRIG